jgi:NitT/TauT family transport system substrate-binding protein
MWTRHNRTKGHPVQRELITGHCRGLGVRSVALMAAILLFATACGSDAENDTDSASADSPVVRVGLICGLMYPIAMPAIQTEAFEGVTIEKQCFDSGASAVQSLIGGSTDVYMGSVEHAITTRAQGLDTKIYAVGSTFPLYALLTASDSPINSLDDLDGKKVGVAAEGSLADTIITAGILRAGLSKGSVTRIGLGAGVTMVEGMNNGAVAAGMLPEPQLSEQVASGDYRIVWEPDFPYMSLTAIARESWVADNEAAMSNFVSSLANFAAKPELEEVASEALAKEGFNVQDDVLQAATERLLGYVPEGLQVDEQVYQDSAQVLVETERLGEDEVPGFDEISDFSLLQTP